jgi:hypothetical protein
MASIVRFRWQIGTCLVTVLAAPGMIAQTGTPADHGNRAMPVPAREEVARYVPQTQQERLRSYFQHMFNPEAVLRSAAGAGINQAMNTPSEWHQGAEGYGRRFASSYAEHLIQSTAMYGASAALHEDNRYFRSGRSGFGPRLKYAIASSFLARHDDGSRHFSISRISSYAASAAISRLWQPPSTNGPVNAADAFAIAIGVETGFNVAREFLPRILHSRPPVD